MCSFNAANDPVHIMHLAQLDSILMKWQSFGQGRESVRYGGDASPLLGAPGFTVEQFINNLALPYGTCLFYDPPILLKNPPPPSSSFSTQSTNTTMDCNPMEIMQNMMSMSTEDQTFLQSRCP